MILAGPISAQAAELECSKIVIDAYASGMLYDLDLGGSIFATPRAIVGPGYLEASSEEKERFSLGVSCFHSKDPNTFEDIQIVDWRDGSILGQVIDGVFHAK